MIKSVWATPTYQSSKLFGVEKVFDWASRKVLTGLGNRVIPASRNIHRRGEYDYDIQTYIFFFL
jgi:hypothetical protein